MLERTALPDTPRPAAGLRLPRSVSVSPQLSRFGVMMLIIALITFIMFMYVLPNSQINAATTKTAELRAEKAELQRRNSEVLQEIARLSDLASLQARARQIGMGPVQSAIYLTMPVSDGRQGAEQRQQQATTSAQPAVVDPADLVAPAVDVKRTAGEWLDQGAGWIDSLLSRLLGD